MQEINELMNYTSLRVEKEVRDKLDSLGTRRESYNDIIKRLIASYELHQKEKKGE